MAKKESVVPKFCGCNPFEISFQSANRYQAHILILHTSYVPYIYDHNVMQATTVGEIATGDPGPYASSKFLSSGVGKRVKYDGRLADVP